MRSYILCLIFTLVLLVAVSCSGGGEVIAPAPGHDAVVNSTGGTLCMGTWQFVIHKDGNVDITQLRAADKVLNVLGFMEPPALSLMGLNNLQVDGDLGIVDVGIILTHPISGDAVFTGFDCRGVCFGPRVANADGVTVIPSPEFFSGVPFGYQDGLLGAPDSYANYEGVAGYKYFCDDLGPDDDVATFFGDTDNLAARGSYGSGEINERHYILEWGPLASDFLIFNYAIYANYNWPVGDAPITLDDFEITTANSAEAFCAAVTELQNSLYYSGSSGGGSFSIQVELWDWQNDIANVTLECDALGIAETAFTTDLGAGSTAYSHIWDFIGVAGTPTATGEVDVIIKAYDTATFGASWFLDLLPASNSLYDDPIWCGFPYVATVSDCPAPSITDVNPAAGKEGTTVPLTINGSGFLAGASLAVELQLAGETDIVATNVVLVSATQITCDVNLTGAADGDWDVVVTNGCGTDGSLVEGFNVFSSIYYTSFDAAENESPNWSRTNTTYWACNWFQGEICDSEATCSTYGTPDYYAWRTAGFTVPTGWTGTPVLMMNHYASKQETYYDRSRVEYSTTSASGPWYALTFYDHAYGSYGWWEYGWANATVHANLAFATPGSSFWIRFASYSLDGWGNAGGWHIYWMEIS